MNVRTSPDAAAGPQSAAVRVAVFEPRPLVAGGLAAVLSADPEIHVIGATSSIDDALGMVAEAGTQAIVFGVPDDSAELCRDLAARFAAAAGGRPLGLIGVVSAGRDVADLLSSGLLAVVTTSVAPDVLRETVMGVVRGEESPLQLSLIHSRTTHVPSAKGDQTSVLTAREREVLRAIGNGLSTKEIAAELGITVNTARTHAQRLMSKLSVHSRLQAAALAADDTAHSILGEREGL
jgi:DNA-binding NarL/FixJ family response regulator